MRTTTATPIPAKSPARLFPGSSPMLIAGCETSTGRRDGDGAGSAAFSFLEMTSPFPFFFSSGAGAAATWAKAASICASEAAGVTPRRAGA